MRAKETVKAVNASFTVVVKKRLIFMTALKTSFKKIGRKAKRERGKSVYLFTRRHVSYQYEELCVGQVDALSVTSTR